MIFFFLLWESEGSFFFVLQWICLLFLHKWFIGMCSNHVIGVILNLPLPLLPEGLNFEKIKKKFSEPLEKHIGSPVSQKASQKSITYFKYMGKISLGNWNPVKSFLGGKIRFKKDKNFPIFNFWPSAKLPKFEQWLWFSYIYIYIYIYILYLVNLYSAGIVSQ